MKDAPTPTIDDRLRSMHEQMDAVMASISMLSDAVGTCNPAMGSAIVERISGSREWAAKTGSLNFERVFRDILKPLIADPSDSGDATH